MGEDYLQQIHNSRSDPLPLGSADFAASLAGHLRLAGREVPKTQRSLARPTLAALRGAGDGKDRAWMREAQRRHGYTQSQIAAEAGLHYSTVSRLIKALEAGPAKRKT